MQKARAKAHVLSSRDEEILKTIYFYRYMTALDVTHRLFAPSSRTHVREILFRLSGNADFQTNQYLYRFRLPSTAPNSERVYTIGARGREYLASVLGLPADWHFRPGKVKHMGYGQVVHNLTLTRFLVAAYAWCARQPDFRLARTRISYELARTPVRVRVAAGRSAVSIPIIPDAWLLFERGADGKAKRSFAVLLEIDRGTAYQHKFKEHISARVEYVASGAYERVFGVPGVIIAYATTGATSEYRETRRKTMCAWTREALADLRMAEWASIFRFHSLSLADIYTADLFGAPVWFKLDDPTPIALLAS